MSETEFEDSPKRFVAGAVCPECQAVDRLQLQTSAVSSRVRRECVACGYTQVLDVAPQYSIPTSIRDRKPQPETAQVVRILEPGPKPSSAPE